MSYILDALKKSENERRAGGVPGLAGGASYVVAPAAGFRHRNAALLAGAGMLVTGLALGHWRPWQETVGAPVLDQALAAPLKALTDAGPAASAEAKTALTAGQKITLADPVPAVQQKFSDGLPVVPVLVPKVVPVLAAPAPVAAKAPVAVAAKPAVAVVGNPAASPLPVVAPPAALAVPAAAPVAAVVAAPPPTDTPAAGVVAWRELPATVRNGLPKIVFGGFAGGGEADGRIAFINNQLVREGEELSPGLKLETVDQDGVVLAYQGHRFRAAP